MTKYTIEVMDLDKDREVTHTYYQCDGEDVEDAADKAGITMHTSSKFNLYSEDEYDEWAKHFLTCAMWSTSGTLADGTELENIDNKLGIEDCPQETLDTAKEYCKDFVSVCTKMGLDLQHNDKYQDNEQWELHAQHAHDLWLTSQGHGAGFWDRGYGPIGQKLTNAAKTFNFDVYVGDGDKVYLS